MQGKYIVFQVGDERFGLPIDSVERILNAVPLTKIPKSPKVIRGIFAHSGTTIAVVSAACRFEIESAGKNQHLLVVHSDQGRFALEVDHVEQIIDFKEDEIDMSQDWLANIEANLAYGVGKKGEELCLLIKPEAIVPETIRKQLEKIAA
jgi:purine-binding chemotaxis protein CheW